MQGLTLPMVRFKGYSEYHFRKDCPCGSQLNLFGEDSMKFVVFFLLLYGAISLLIGANLLVFGGTEDSRDLAANWLITAFLLVVSAAILRDITDRHRR